MFGFLNVWNKFIYFFLQEQKYQLTVDIMEDDSGVYRNAAPRTPSERSAGKMENSEHEDMEFV